MKSYKRKLTPIQSVNTVTPFIAQTAVILCRDLNNQIHHRLQLSQTHNHFTAIMWINQPALAGIATEKMEDFVRA